MFRISERLIGAIIFLKAEAQETTRLRLFGFIRIHRSVLVNCALLKKIQPGATGDYELRLKGGSECTVTRTYKKT